MRCDLAVPGVEDSEPCHCLQATACSALLATQDWSDDFDHYFLLHGREMTDLYTGKAPCLPKKLKPAVFCWASMIMSTTIGDVIFSSWQTDADARN